MRDRFYRGSSTSTKDYNLTYRQMTCVKSKTRTLSTLSFSSLKYINRGCKLEKKLDKTMHCSKASNLFHFVAAALPKFTLCIMVLPTVHRSQWPECTSSKDYSARHFKRRKRIYSHNLRSSKVERRSSRNSHVDIFLRRDGIILLNGKDQSVYIQYSNGTWPDPHKYQLVQVLNFYPMNNLCQWLEYKRRLLWLRKWHEMFSKLGLFVLTLKLFNTVAASGRIKEVNSPKGKSRADASERRVKNQELLFCESSTTYEGN